ncbi:MAG TPA: carbonic anhydrase [Rhizomicrobium sp.]|jgi:carbonic anhydrase|nr:carbonic anhydrase [Rhizomicrobium sp.]
MCDHQSAPTRRGVFALAGGVVALSALPAAAAGHVEALGFTCIDYRVVDEAADLFHKQGLTNQYDMLALAGASLAATSEVFPSSNAAFWDHVAIAKKLHSIKKVVVIDHRDCGAYKVAFGKDYADGGAAELAQHKGVMAKLKDALATKHPDLGFEAYLLAIDGSAERVL